MSKYTKRVMKHKRGGTRKRNIPAEVSFFGCSGDYQLTPADAPRYEELSKLTNMELRDKISMLVGEGPGKSTPPTSMRKEQLIRLFICMENKPSSATLLRKLTEFHPVQLEKSPGLLPKPLACGDGQKCPTGFRCDTDLKSCYKLTDLTVRGNNKSVSLSVDSHRGKQHDLLFLGANIDRILELKGSRNGKKITGKMLNEEVLALKAQLKGRNVEIGNTYYGTLNDEMIIQILYLEELLRQSQPKVEIEPAVEPSVEPAVEIEPAVEVEPAVEIEPAVEVEPAVEIEPSVEIEPILEPIPDLKLELSADEQRLQEQIGVMPNDVDSTEYNQFLFKREKLEHENAQRNTAYDFLYPELDDPEFNTKIAQRKEFYDTQYDGKIYNIEEHAAKMCSADFELMPHQLFVKNFLSFQTPYNAMLLYHGLGTGKTCSAIGVAEEMRTYMKQIGYKHRIIVVASPNVQNNFKLQLFDERKLKKDGEVWNLHTCIGNALLNEVIPTQTMSLPKDRIILMINALINQYYVFMGYGEFANFIKRKTQVDDIELGITQREQKDMEIGKIRKIFNNRLIIVDEVHNIRLMQENKQSKKTASLLMHVCKYADNMRLLLLSATPMFNSYKEIIWLCNLMNMVDKRSTIKEEDVFDKEGNFIPAKGDAAEGGRELLQRKLTGYISHVRGENPYSFPYRIYTETFSPENAMDSNNYPSVQMNKKPIDAPLKHVPVYMNANGSYQARVYKSIIDRLMTQSFNTTNLYGAEREMPTFENMESFGYTQLKAPLEALNIVFPNANFVETDLPVSANALALSLLAAPNSVPKEPEVEPESESESETESETETGGESGRESEIESESETETEIKPGRETAQFGGADIVSNPPAAANEDALEIINSMIGKQGLANVMQYKSMRNPYELRYDFEYKSDVVARYGRMFHSDHLSKYSGKIANICNIIRKSKGIIMIYSQYIDGGVVPIALALEEMGFTRYGSASYTKSLFKTPPTEQVDATTLLPLSQTEDKTKYSPAKYVMITGDKSFSPNNLADLNYATNLNNLRGEKVRVILITKAAAEGLDFKNIRQLHILEPWYNMNRTEQIIGRAVRNLSHCALPFADRNVEIYLHATQPTGDEEPADLYVYRFAEKKAIQIGRVSRLLKEIAVDCILNIGQTNFTVDKLMALAANQRVKLQLSSGIEVDYQIGDRPGTDICDYMDDCNFVCSPTIDLNAETKLTETTYSEEYAKMNFASIVKQIRALFKEQVFYPRDILTRSVQINREYPIEHIDYALSYFVDNPNEHLVDKYGRVGYLINTDDIYAFQPIEITDEKSSIFDRSVPITYKPSFLPLELPLEKNQMAVNDTVPSVSKQLDSITDKYTTDYQLDAVRNDYAKIRETMESKIATIREYRANKSITQGDTDWYKHLGKEHNRLTGTHQIPEETIQQFAVSHYIDGLSIEDRLHMVYYLFHPSIRSEQKSAMAADAIDAQINKYFDDKVIRSPDQVGIVLAANNRIDLYIQNKESNQWVQAEPTEIRTFHGELQKRFTVPDKMITQSTNPPRVIGFMHLFKKNEMVFKLKELTNRRNNKGSKCGSLGKVDIIKRLNRLLEENPYATSAPYSNADAETILRPGLCVIVEMIMRHFNEHPGSKRNRIWFFDVENALANKIIDLKG